MSEGIVKCGHCGGLCIRPAFSYQKQAHPELPLVYTRTLVGAAFVPSCSKTCAEALRPVQPQTRYAV